MILFQKILLREFAKTDRITYGIWLKGIYCDLPENKTLELTSYIRFKYQNY